MGWLWLGLLIGLAVGAGVLALVLRAVGGLTGTDLRSVGRLIVDGLTPGRRREGVVAQRALARRLRRAGERTASGRRVAAEEVTVHVSPEDHAAIDAALGVPAAEADLAEFYRAHASRGGWIVGAEPQVRIVRDISLRPRQAFVRAPARAAHPGHAGQPPPAAQAASNPEPPRPPEPARQDARTDVLPHALLEAADGSATAVLPVGRVGDLVVVHGTDVRTRSPSAGALRIGRGRHNDLVLDRPGVARDHLVVEARTDGWWVVPGTSPGGTLLDGAALDGPAPILGGATLELGRGVRLRLSVDPS